MGLCFLVYVELDRVQHKFWKSNRVEDRYILLDRKISDLIEY
jgi:hypothetical protein